MRMEIKLSFTLRKDRPRGDPTGPEPRDSAVDALVERADDGRRPELHELSREPPQWEDRRIGFRPNSHN